MADSLETAWLEVKAHAGEARPDMRAYRAWRVTLPEGVTRELVDLRDRKEQERYGMKQADLETDPAPESGRMLAGRLRREGKSGIIYRSVRNRPHGVCAAIFLDVAEAELHVESAAEEWKRFCRQARSNGKGTHLERGTFRVRSRSR